MDMDVDVEGGGGWCCVDERLLERSFNFSITAVSASLTDLSARRAVVIVERLFA